MGGTPLFGGSWGPILQLDLENWMVFLEVVNLTYHILDFTLGQYSPDDPLKEISAPILDQVYVKISLKKYFALSAFDLIFHLTYIL